MKLAKLSLDAASKISAGVLRTGSAATQLAVAGTAMTTMAMMRGGVQKADEMMMQRYMKDTRFSSKLSSNTSVGRSSNISKISIGNHTGLALALSKRRHG